MITLPSTDPLDNLNETLAQTLVQVVDYMRGLSSFLFSPQQTNLVPDSQIAIFDITYIESVPTLQQSAELLKIVISWENQIIPSPVVQLAIDINNLFAIKEYLYIHQLIPRIETKQKIQPTLEVQISAEHAIYQPLINTIFGYVSARTLVGPEDFNPFDLFGIVDIVRSLGPGSYNCVWQIEAIYH